MLSAILASRVSDRLMSRVGVLDLAEALAMDQATARRAITWLSTVGAVTLMTYQGDRRLGLVLRSERRAGSV